MAHPKRFTKNPRRKELKTVPAGRTRHRMLILSREGIGRKAIHEITGIDHRALSKIRNGQTRYVRKETRDLIFSVPFNAHSDRALIDAQPTLRLVQRLTDPQVGFTKAEIAYRLRPELRKKNRMATLRLGREKSNGTYCDED